jgi:hypothetical protein
MWGLLLWAASCVTPLRREFVERAGNFVPSFLLVYSATVTQSLPWWAAEGLKAFQRASGSPALAQHVKTSFDAHVALMATVFVCGVLFCLVQRAVCLKPKRD